MFSIALFSEGSISSARICSFIREHPSGTWVISTEGVRGVMPLPQIRGFFDYQHAHTPFLRNARGRHPLGSVCGVSGKEVSDALLSILSRVEGSELLFALTKDQLRSRTLSKRNSEPNETPADAKKKKKKQKNRDVTVDFCQQIFKRSRIPVLFGEFPTQVIIRTAYGGFRCVPPLDESHYLEALLKVFRMQVAVELQSFSGTPSTLKDGPVVDASSLAGLRLPIMPAPLDLGAAATGLITASSALRLAMIELRKQSQEWFTQWRRTAEESGPLVLYDPKKILAQQQAVAKQMQQQQDRNKPVVGKRSLTGAELNKTLESLEEGKKKIGFVNLLEKDPTLLFSSYWPFDKGFVPLQALFVRVDIEEQLLDMPVAEKLPPAPPLFGPLQALNGIVVGASAVYNPSKLLMTDTSSCSDRSGGRLRKGSGLSCDVEQLSIGGHNHGTICHGKSKLKRLSSAERRKAALKKEKAKRRKEIIQKCLLDIIPDFDSYDRRSKSSFKRIVSTCVAMRRCKEPCRIRKRRIDSDGEYSNDDSVVSDESVVLDAMIARRMDVIQSDNDTKSVNSTIETVATSQISDTYVWDWDWWNPKSKEKTESVSDSDTAYGTLRITETRRRRSCRRVQSAEGLNKKQRERRASATTSNERREHDSGTGEVTKNDVLEILPNEEVCRCIPSTADMINCSTSNASLVDVYIMTPKDFDDMNYVFDHRCQKSFRSGVGTSSTGGGNGGWIWWSSLFGDSVSSSNLPLHWKNKLPMSRWIRTPGYAISRYTHFY